MTYMKKLATFLLVIAALLATTDRASAQYYETYEKEDTQLHTGFDVSGKISERWGINWGEEFYFGNNMSEYQKVYSRLMVEYYLKPNLRLSPLVMVVSNQQTGGRTMIYDFNVIYTHRIDKLGLTMRGGTRLQDVLGMKERYNGQIKRNPEFQLRGHVAAGYRVLGWLEPFANIEAFLLMNPITDFRDNPELYKIYDVGHYLPRVRSNVGVKFHVSKHSTVELYWRYDHTRTKYLSYELMDAPFGIITNDNFVNFLGVFYHQKF